MFAFYNIGIVVVLEILPGGWQGNINSAHSICWIQLKKIGMQQVILFSPITNQLIFFSKIPVNNCDECNNVKSYGVFAVQLIPVGRSVHFMIGAAGCMRDVRFGADDS